MGNADGASGMFEEGLADAGCDGSMIEKCSCLRDDGMPGAVRALLNGHRRELLEQLRSKQREIDCLDHVLYELERETRR